ncbi:MAG TPA: hypothetical protein VGS08_03440 [Candidatus Saccharimonadales bacterium]|nr:hypothetical protein [Candidatus Saccharimonadales bacterium]
MEVDKAKKRARLAVSLRYTSNHIGFLHANLIVINGKHFLIAGSSGIGKTGYAEYLCKTVGAEVLANDWVAIECEGTYFYASDLNFADNMRHPERCLLAGVIFLTSTDTLDRDAYVPNEQEFEALLRETFDTATEKEFVGLASFWLHNRSNLPPFAAIPARRRAEAYTAETLRRVIEKISTSSKTIEVGVIGIGAIGTELAFQLGQLSFVNKVHLYNRTSNRAKGYALDMNHAVTPTNSGKVFVAHENAAEVFTSSSVVFLAFRDESLPPLAELPERWQKLPSHLAIVKQYAKIIHDTNFSGTIFVITNPVDILTYSCYALTQTDDYALRTYQVYGIGLEVDAARASV